jgi:hypothetical protein
VDENTFNAARAAVARRKTKKERGGAIRRVGRRVFLFSGLIFDAVDGSVYYAGTKTENGAPRYYDDEGKRRRGTAEPGREKRYQRFLINAASGEGRGPARSFPLATFERAILSKLREIDSREVLGETSPAADVAGLERQVRWLADRQAELAAELRNGDIPVIAQQIRELKAEEDELAAKLDEARQLAAKPLSETWRDLSALADSAADPDARRRLRSSIARVVERIRLLVVPRGRDRLAWAEVHFAGGAGPKGLRTYVIVHRPPLWTGKGVRPGAWWCHSARAMSLDTAYPWASSRGGEQVEDEDPMSSVYWWLKSVPREAIDKVLASEEAHVIE